jgi:hypothetical protein
MFLVGNSDIYRIVKMIMERHYDPVIVFSFSKKQCEILATQMAKLDFNDGNLFQIGRRERGREREREREKEKEKERKCVVLNENACENDISLIVCFE